MVLLISSYLLLVFLVPVALSLAVGYRSLPRSSACPECGRATNPLAGRFRRVRPLLLRPLRLERRWCMHCGWEGNVRRPRVPLMQTLPAAAAAEATQSLDVRTLRVDGRTWRVQLQCWRVELHCYGRLVFIDPAGRPWTDGDQAFSASTQFQVLGQALSIPDRALASRLRQITTAE